MSIVREHKFVRVSAGRIVSDPVTLPKQWGGIDDLHDLSLEQLRALGWFPFRGESGCCRDAVFNTLALNAAEGFAESRYIDNLDVCKSRATAQVAQLLEAKVQSFRFGELTIGSEHFSALLTAQTLGTDALLTYGERDVTLPANQVRSVLLGQQEHVRHQNEWARKWWRKIRDCISHEELIDVVEDYRDAARNG